MIENGHYVVDVAGLRRELPLLEIQPGLRIALLNILGDIELTQAAGKALAEKLSAIDYAAIITPEAKSIPLAYALALEVNKPYVVLRKDFKPYMGDALQIETLSITTGHPQTLFLDEKDREFVQGKPVVIVDDVISTGSTLEGMRALMEKAGATIAAEAAIFTEGDLEKWSDVVSLGHLPVFVD